MAKKIESYTAQSQTGILLNANECSNNVDETILQEIADSLPSIAMNRYPDNDQIELLEKYGSVMGLSKDQLLAGNGSDQMLGLLIGTFIGKGKTLYTYDPDFSMYDYYVSSYEGNMKKFVIHEDGTLDVDAFIAEGKGKVDLVMFSNPNNPTGNCLCIEDVKKIVDGFYPTPVVVDEAYFEFSNETSALTLLNQCTNLYVTRTLSKAYGIAGVRVGFLASNEENMKSLKPMAVPYGLNSISMKVAVIVLNHADEVQQRVQQIRKSRDAMLAQLQNLKNVFFFASQANFLYGKCDQKEELLKCFQKNDITIRDYAGKNRFRITIGNEEENQAVLRAITAFEEEFK